MHVDEAFIRRAVELAEPNALRTALYHTTGEQELVRLGRAPFDDDCLEWLRSMAVDFLKQYRGPVEVPPPADADLRRLMELAVGEPISDGDFSARRNIPAFDDVPWSCEWTVESPRIPNGFQVAVVGAGYNGVAVGIALERLGIPYFVLERRHEIGGVWSINTYPDCRVDTPSAMYEFNFEKRHPWSEYFARQSEVRGYLENVAKKYGVHDHVRFNCDLREARFDEARSLWQLSVGRPDGSIELMEANVVVSAAGLFATPKIPEFVGREDFEGKLVHPSQWSPDCDVSGRSVAVVGNGSTGVQLVAPVAREAKQVYVFQRTPQWISPRPRYGEPVEPEMRWLLDTMPAYWNWARFMTVLPLFASHELLIPDIEWQRKGGYCNEKNDLMREDLIAYIKAEVGDRPDLVERLIPNYPPLARRPVIDNGWYRALTRDNVELVTDGIRRLTPTGIETVDGRERTVDLIAAATGFDVVKYLWPADYIGAGGASLQQRWSTDGPRAYVGIMVPDFPNLFMVYGPNSQPVSGGVSLPSWFQIWARYVAQCLVTMLEGGHARVEVSASAFEQYNAALDEEASGLIVVSDQESAARNYYVNEFGRMQVNAPWETAHYYERLAEPHWDDIVLS